MGGEDTEKNETKGTHEEGLSSRGKGLFEVIVFKV